MTVIYGETMGCGSSIGEPLDKDRPPRATSIKRMDKLKAERGKLKKDRTSASEGLTDDLSQVSASSSPKSQRKSKTRMADFINRLTTLIEDNPEDDDGRVVMGEQLYDILDVRHKGIVKLHDLQEGFNRLGWDDSPQSIRHLFGESDATMYFKKDAAEFEISKLQFLDMFKQIKTMETLRTGADPDFASNFKKRTVKRVWAPGTRNLRGCNIRPLFMLPSRVKAIIPNRCATQFICCERDSLTLNLVSTCPGEGLTRRLETPDIILDVTLSPDLKYIGAALRDCTLALYDSTCMHQSKQYHHPYAVTCCAFTPDSAQMLTGCYDSLVRRFDVSKGRLIHTTAPMCNVNRGVVVVIACVQQFAVVTRTREPGLDILDVKSLRTLKRLETGHSALAWVLKITSCGTYMLSLCEKYINVWDTSPLLSKEVMKYVPNLSIEVSSVEKHGPPVRDQKLSWFGATFLPSSLSHYFIASSSDLALTIVNMEGVPIMVLYSVFPIFTFGVCDDSEPIFAGDSAGNVLTIIPF